MPPETTSSHPNIDPEELAKLLDGRLSPEERERLLARLDVTPEARSALADAAVSITELSAGSTNRDTVSIQSARSRFRWILPLAAVVAFAIATPWLTRGEVSGIEPVSRIVAGLPAAVGANGGWKDRPWREFRGTAERITPRARDVRIGALLVELEALAASGDSAAIRTAAQLAILLDGYPGGTIVGDQYRALALRGALSNAEARRRALANCEILVDGDALRTGAWLQRARIAAATGDSAFFVSKSTDGAIHLAQKVAIGDAAAQDAVARLAESLSKPRPDWSRVIADLDGFLAAIAS